jgi:hypothetical protein
MAAEGARCETPSSSHKFEESIALRRLLERKRPVQAQDGPNSRVRYRDVGVRGIVEHNEHLVASGALPRLTAELISVGAVEVDAAPRFSTTVYSVANTDTVSAALRLLEPSPDDAAPRVCVLTFANPDIPGGRYVSGGRAQEEDLCRLLPQLYGSLEAAAAELGAYPLRPGSALLTRGCVIARHPKTYVLNTCRPANSEADAESGSVCGAIQPLGVVSVVTAAMPCGAQDNGRPKEGWIKSAWGATVRTRVSSVLEAAVAGGATDLVLGAFGCGAFGNPVRPVAQCFAEVLRSSRYRGCFRRVAFAIIDPVGTGNLKPFAEEIVALSADG